MDTIVPDATSNSSDFEDFDESGGQPSGRRWDPLGAAKNDDEDGDKTTLADYGDTDSRDMHNTDPGRIKSLEDEQEMLSSSLFALTSHFAQVQFRLRQIVDSPAEQRDQLLQSLEEFAFRGIPDEVTNVNNSSSNSSAISNSQASDVGEHEPLFKAMEHQRNRQIDLIEQLKRQLTDVERFAYESGSKILPQSMLVEKQRVIIDELRDKLNLNVCDADLPQLSSEELRNQVDTALVELVGPMKMKDTLVGQLKTQIVDLERFVAHLQCETYDLKQMTKAMGGLKNCETEYSTYNSKMAKSRHQSRMGSTTSQGCDREDETQSPTTPSSLFAASTSASTADHSASTPKPSKTETLSDKAAGVLEKASNILNIFAVTQLGCGAHNFQKNTLKRTTKGNHWGDLRAQLEIDVQEIISLVSSVTQQRRRRLSSTTRSAAAGKYSHSRALQAAVVESSSSDNDEDDDDDEDAEDDTDEPASAVTAQPRVCETLANVQLEITTMVRKHFAITLQRLVEHGLCENVASSSSSLVPFIGCFARPRFASGPGRRGAYDDFDDLAVDDSRRQMHAWELCLAYYHTKNGEQFNETPARTLSQSFNLDITDGSSTATSNKQGLLSAIGNIINMHSPYKRSANSHFKALVSMGLNCQKLPQWLNLLFQCREVVQQYYTDWSYVRRTGFRDGLKCLERLSCYHFDLPVDLAIRQFQNIKDVF